MVGNTPQEEFRLTGSLVMIWTSKGYLLEGLLTKKTLITENGNEYTEREEWRDASGEVVKSNAHVRLKRWPEGLDPATIKAFSGNLGS